MIGRCVQLVVLMVVLAACGQAPATMPMDGAGLRETAQGVLDTQLAAIETAVTANDIAAARTAFDEFQTAWGGMEANVATAAPAVRDAIADAMATLETQVDAPALDAAAVTATLDQLRAGLESLASE